MMKNNLDKVMKVFCLLWLLTGIGMGIGVFVPQVLILPIAILTIALLIISIFTRKFIKLGKWLIYAISLLLGITLYSAVAFYVGSLGLSIVLLVFGTCVVLFISLGLFGYKSNRDFSSWGIYLFIALIGLIVFSLIAIFVPMSNVVMLIASAIGVIIFVGFTIYDFNMIAKEGVADEDVHIVALNLQLDFLNLFLELLRVVYYLVKILED